MRDLYEKKATYDNFEGDVQETKMEDPREEHKE